MNWKRRAVIGVAAGGGMVVLASNSLEDFGRMAKKEPLETGITLGAALVTSFVGGFRGMRGLLASVAVPAGVTVALDRDDLDPMEVLGAGILGVSLWLTNKVLDLVD